MAPPTPDSKRSTLLVRCTLPDGSLKVVTLKHENPITSTPPSKRVKRSVEHLYEETRAEDLTCLPLDRVPGGPWECLVTADDGMARVKSRMVSPP